MSAIVVKSLTFLLLEELAKYDILSTETNDPNALIIHRLINGSKDPAGFSISCGSYALLYFPYVSVRASVAQTIMLTCENAGFNTANTLENTIYVVSPKTHKLDVDSLTNAAVANFINIVTLTSNNTVDPRTLVDYVNNITKNAFEKILDKKAVEMLTSLLEKRSNTFHPGGVLTERRELVEPWHAAYNALNKRLEVLEKVVKEKVNLATEEASPEPVKNVSVLPGIDIRLTQLSQLINQTLYTVPLIHDESMMSYVNFKDGTIITIRAFLKGLERTEQTLVPIDPGFLKNISIGNSAKLNIMVTEVEFFTTSDGKTVVLNLDSDTHLICIGKWTVASAEGKVLVEDLLDIEVTTTRFMQFHGH